MRLLNNFNIADKDLVVKVDAKTRKILEEYLSDRIKKGGDELEVPKEDEIENYEDEDIKYEDGLTRDRIQQILADHAQEIESYIPKEAKELPQAREQVPSATLIQRMGTRDEILAEMPQENIASKVPECPVRSSCLNISSFFKYLLPGLSPSVYSRLPGLPMLQRTFCL